MHYLDYLKEILSVVDILVRCLLKPVFLFFQDLALGCVFFIVFFNKKSSFFGNILVFSKHF